MNKLDILKNKKFNLQARLRALSSEMFSAMRDCRCDGDFNALLDVYEKNRNYLKQQLIEVDSQIVAVIDNKNK